jgi:hypothetical protein
VLRHLQEANAPIDMAGSSVDEIHCFNEMNDTDSLKQLNN